MTKFTSLAIIAMFATVAVSTVNGYVIEETKSQQDSGSQDVTEAQTEKSIEDQFQKQYKQKKVDIESLKNDEKEDKKDWSDTLKKQLGKTDGIQDKVSDVSGQADEKTEVLVENAEPAIDTVDNVAEQVGAADGPVGNVADVATDGPAGNVADVATNGQAGNVADAATDGPAGNVADAATNGQAGNVADAATDGPAGNVADVATDGPAGNVVDGTTDNIVP